MVGGLAVVLHGVARLTADLDLVVDLEPIEARRAVDALVSLGMRPRAPVDAADFADPRVRNTWISERHMRVFSMFDPGDALRDVDLFVQNSIDFEELWGRSVVVDVGNTTARIASIGDLIAMKRAVGRPQDLTDVEALEIIIEHGGRRD